MGLGNIKIDARDELKCEGRGIGYENSFGESVISCSICLEIVADNGDRSWAKLHCGHQFHLDCIGSAFNAKGAMQCPNCRKIEKGQWLYANGHRPLPDLNFEDLAHEEDLYDLTYSEMSFDVHWCPFNSLTSGEDFPPNAYLELPGQHLPDPCPYLAYVGPVYHPSSSTLGGNVSEVPSFNAPNSYPFPAVDVHYHSPPHFAPTNRADTENPRLGLMHQFVSHRASSSSISPVFARTRDRVQALQAYYQQHGGSPPGSRRASGYRGSPAATGSVASSSSEQGVFYFAPGRTFPESENHPIPVRYREWAYPVSQGDRETSRVSSFHAIAGNQEAGGLRRQRAGFLHNR